MSGPSSKSSAFRRLAGGALDDEVTIDRGSGDSLDPTAADGRDLLEDARLKHGMVECQ